ncbi:unnamed protein product [Cylicocyclus nassatus]|uniref:Glycosyltransferase family 92 protein n=1 Tax=Cylicocyclus nassatus TaxID=53992 RepID=A0AA36H779_CYLNA|nr:unnamed protein product [Cylicocyclus nassatus]
MWHNTSDTVKKASIATNTIPNIAFYNRLMKQRVVTERGGEKTAISLLSAFEYPQQINVMVTSIARYGDKIYCRYFDMLMQEIGNPFESVVFPKYTIMCLRREGARFMSLSETSSGQYEYPVPITDRTQSEPTHFLSICLSPIYGTEPKWLQLAELVEHYKIQGATYFYIYSKYIDAYSRILLDDYVRTGDAEVIILHDHSEREDYRWQFMEIHECLNRARGHSRWVAFVDLDERLTPTDYSGTGLTDDNIGGIRFRQRWILKNETLPERYVDANQVLIMYVHDVAVFFENYTMYRMKPEEGVIRHYRDVNAGQWSKKWLGGIERMGNFSMTDYPEKWANELLSKVQKRIHYVYGPKK